MQVKTICTPASFISDTWADKSGCAYWRLMSKVPILMSGAYFSKLALNPSPHFCDSALTPYARMPTLVTLFCVASHGAPCPRQPKQDAPSVPKMLSFPAISGLMFQMNVGILAAWRSPAPVNRTVAMNIANALSCARLAFTSG